MLKNSGAAIASAVTLAAAGAFCIGSAANAFGDAAASGTNSSSLGSPVNIGGQTWTVSNLKQSSDAIPYQARGTLWEATATDEAVQGGATPMVSNLNATSPGGQTYRVLYQVATPQGVNPAGLVQGQKTTGKIYFDVTGDNPTGVVYREAGGQDLASWVQTTTPTGGTGAHASASSTGVPSASSPFNKPAAPAGNATGTPAAAARAPRFRPAVKGHRLPAEPRPRRPPAAPGRRFLRVRRPPRTAQERLLRPPCRMRQHLLAVPMQVCRVPPLRLRYRMRLIRLRCRADLLPRMAPKPPHRPLEAKGRQLRLAALLRLPPRLRTQQCRRRAIQRRRDRTRGDRPPEQARIDAEEAGVKFTPAFLFASHCSRQ